MASYSIVSKQSADYTLSKNTWILLALLAAAFVLRLTRLGDPAIQVDEEFYLLVGDRMWHGALPYVDIWDRKPILLFLIYATLRPFSPDGIVAYQIAATLFVAGTAYCIALIARRITNPIGASLAGVAYILYLPLLGGAGGQSPVFYNLLMALGALEVVRAQESYESKGLWQHGLRCMFWVGLAIQVKYIAAIEGVGFGLWLLGLRIARDRGVTRASAVQTCVWILVALAPTLLALGFYTVIGHAQEFVQANFLSIFQKHSSADFPSADILSTTVIKLGPLLFITFFALPFLWWFRKAGGLVLFLMFWMAFAIIGFSALGNYYDHYALPLLVPITILCASMLGTPVGGFFGIGTLVIFIIMAYGFPPGAEVRHMRESAVLGMVEAARPYAAKGCLYLYDTPPIVYHLTHSCLPPRYVFPGHMSEGAEAEATDSAHSMETILATKPSAIFIADKPTEPQPPNLVTAAILAEALARDYKPVATMQDILPWRHQILYVRKDLLPPEVAQHQ